MRAEIRLVPVINCYGFCIEYDDSADRNTARIVINSFGKFVRVCGSSGVT